MPSYRIGCQYEALPILLVICDLASENRPYDIFNPNGVMSIML